MLLPLEQELSKQLNQLIALVGETKLKKSALAKFVKKLWKTEPNKENRQYHCNDMNIKQWILKEDQMFHKSI